MAQLPGQQSNSGTVRQSSPWRAAAFLVGGPAALLLAYGTSVWAYDFWLGSRQDRCSFGEVSNERYRDWLVKAREARPLSSVNFGSVKIRFEKFSQAVSSIDERVAIVHAMMRADGFRLASVTPVSHQPFEDAKSVVRFRYKKFWWKGLLFGCAFGCEVRAYSNFYLTDLGLSHIKPNQFTISVYPPELKSGPWRPSQTEGLITSCPQVPTPEWSAKFLKSYARE